MYVKYFLFAFFDGGVVAGVFFEEVVEDVFAEETDEFSGLFGDGDVSDFADDVVEAVFGDVLFGDGEEVVQLFAVGGFDEEFGGAFFDGFFLGEAGVFVFEQYAGAVAQVGCLGGTDDDAFADVIFEGRQSHPRGDHAGGAVGMFQTLGERAAEQRLSVEEVAAFEECICLIHSQIATAVFGVYVEVEGVKLVVWAVEHAFLDDHRFRVVFDVGMRVFSAEHFAENGKCF